MGMVVDLMRWKASRGAPSVKDGAAATANRDDGAARLEAAVARLDGLVTKTMEARGSLDAAVETELLAIMGAITAGLVDDAAERAERLAKRLVAN
jgi:hypothetical protein